VTDFKVRSKPVKIAEVRLGEEEVEAVTQVVLSGALREGKKCAELEARFAATVGAEKTTTLSSGTAALHAAYSYFLEPGDEVIVPAMTFFATASMVCWAKAVPVFCDVDPETFCLDVGDARKRITKKTKAIAPVHLFGNAADVDGILDLAHEFGLKIIWDAAQAHLTSYKGRDVGSFPGAVCYSLYATKNMTTGEGGLIASDDSELIRYVETMKRQGQEGKYRHTMLGTNYRMTDMQAAIGLVQLEKLGQFSCRRQHNAGFYNETLVDIPGIQIPKIPFGIDHTFHQYTILIEPTRLNCSRDEFADALRAKNVQVGVNYPVPLYRQPVFERIIDIYEPLPVSENMANTCLSLPVQPFLTDDDLQYVVNAIKITIDEFAA